MSMMGLPLSGEMQTWVYGGSGMAHMGARGMGMEIHSPMSQMGDAPPGMVDHFGRSVPTGPGRGLHGMMGLVSPSLITLSVLWSVGSRDESGQLGDTKESFLASYRFPAPHLVSNHL